MNVNYWIAQYVDDLFRREPRNVGVFVEADGEVGARFLAVTDNGEVDGRKLRGRVEHIDVYRQWVDFWSTEVRHGSLSEVLSASGAHYRVLEGGKVDDVEVGELPEVVDYLYSMLVTEHATRDMLMSVEDEATAASLIVEVSEAFKAENILAVRKSAVVPHPVRRAVPVAGKLKLDYRPTFTQENGSLYIMEAVDFTGSKKKLARDHAGWTAYTFVDVKAVKPATETIAIVKVLDIDAAEDEDVRGGMAVLGNEARVVNWLKDEERRSFIAERLRVAKATQER